jgi:uncharacterized membrane protein YoaK (UPF0700 family)
MRLNFTGSELKPLVVFSRNCRFSRVQNSPKPQTYATGRIRQMSHRIEGKIKKADKIVGNANPRTGKKFDVQVRLTRLGDLD